MRMAKHRGAAVACAVVAGLTLAACSSQSSSESTSSSAAAASSSAGAVDGSTAASAAPVDDPCLAEPVAGGNLTYARQFETLTLNPIDIRNGNGDIFADGLLYEGLVRYDPEGPAEIVPALAESWEVSPDGLTYTFKLRSDAKFSNGDPVTAEDVKFSLDRFGNQEVNQVMGLLANGYKSSEVIDPTTFAIHLSTPVPAFLDNIAVFPAFVVPKKLVEEQGDEFWKKPVGSGPFMVDEYVSGASLKMSKNPYYWDTGKPYLDGVTFNFATDSNARLLALQSGEAQMADGISPSKIQELKDDPNLVVESFKWPAWFAIFMNEKKPELADVNVRQAMAYAIDRDTINEQIFDGLASVPNSLFANLRYDSDAVAPYTFDLAKAKELMAASGFPDGFSVKLEYPSGIDYYNQLTLALKQQLSEIGIDVELVKVDGATMADNLHGDYDMTFGYPQVSSDIAVPDEYATFFGVPSANDGFHTYFADPEIEKLVTEFTTETDESKRAAEWAVLQQKFMDAQIAINVLNYPLINARAKNVCGADVNAMGVDSLQNTWLAAG